MAKTDSLFDTTFPERGARARTDQKRLPAGAHVRVGASGLPVTHGSDSEAEQVFEQWCAAVRTRENLADATQTVNKSMWMAYTLWLSDQRFGSWKMATSETIARFLKGPAPGQFSRRHPLNASVMSNFTRQRYWRILRGIYHHAQGKGLIAVNPCVGMQDSAPRILERDLKPQVLPPGLLSLLQDQHLLRSIIKPSRQGDWTALRDRAAMALLIECGLTTAELIALRGVDLAVGDAPLIHAMEGARHAQRSLQGEALDPLRTLSPDDNPAHARHPGAPIRLCVPSSSDMVSRSFVLSESCAILVLPWVALREQQLHTFAALNGPPTERNAYLLRYGLRGALLFSRQGISKNDPTPSMVPATIYHLVKRTFLGVFNTPQGAAMDKRKEGVKVAQGASIIRNTLIQHWAQTLGAQAAIERAGFQRADSLRVAADLIAHVAPGEGPREVQPELL